jgi:hypothetical protein
MRLSSWTDPRRDDKEHIPIIHFIFQELFTLLFYTKNFHIALFHLNILLIPKHILISKDS